MSGRKRFFVEKIEYPSTSSVVLEGDEFTHAKVVQRVDAGDEIVLLDGSGREYFAIVASVEKKRLIANIVSAMEGDKEPKTDIYLLTGALKGDKTELVVQKATELGIKKIGVFSSQYCSAYMNDNKIERLNKVAKEAAKQCMRSRAPEIEYFDNFNAALNSCGGYDNKIFACEFAESSDTDLAHLKGSVALVVGSEGGFSKEEATLSKELGFSLISLGKRILRAETACIALTAITAFTLGELK